MYHATYCKRNAACAGKLQLFSKSRVDSDWVCYIITHRQPTESVEIITFRLFIVDFAQAYLCSLRR